MSSADRDLLAFRSLACRGPPFVARRVSRSQLLSLLHGFAQLRQASTQYLVTTPQVLMLRKESAFDTVSVPVWTCHLDPTFSYGNIRSIRSTEPAITRKLTARLLRTVTRWQNNPEPRYSTAVGLCLSSPSLCPHHWPSRCVRQL